MPNVTNHTEKSITGTYGMLTITYRRLTYTWTVTVYTGPTRINELCGAWDNPQAAYREAQRIARAAHQGVKVHDIIAAKPSELVLAELAAIVGTASTLADTVPAPTEVRQVRPTLARAHLAPLADAQIRALRAAAGNSLRTVYAGDVTRPTLRALARKGYGLLNYRAGMGRRKVVESLTLNQRGLDYAREQVAA